MSKLLKIATPLVAILGLAVANTVTAADLDGKKLFTDRTCHTCHGKDAKSPLMPNYPAIAGQSKEYLIQQMKDIKSGTRNNAETASMKGVMHLVSDDEIGAIATYVASLEFGSAKIPVDKATSKKAEKKETAPATAAGHAKKAGKHDGTGEKVWMTTGGEREVAMDLEPNKENGIEVYEVCAGCHLTEGWGKPDGTFPQLAGQHRSVLIKQLADIRSKNRDNPTMYPFALPESIGDEQAMADVTAYIAKIPMNPDNGKGQWDERTPEFEQGKKTLCGQLCKMPW